jgi:hypothetical protein
MPGKRIAIAQSNYVPWKGYFDLINMVDEFVLLDNVQYTRRDWRNRNRIKSAGGTRWITIPVETKGRYLQRIDQTRISDPGWRRSHWDLLRQTYAGTPHFSRYRPELERLYLHELTDPLLTNVNRRLLEYGCSALGIVTPLSAASDYEPGEGTSDRLLDICLKAGATTYLSGPAARGYLEEERFREAGVGVEWMSYEGYPPYEQIHPPFVHGVSVLDLLFHLGPEAPSYMLSFGARAQPGAGGNEGLP